MNIEVICTGDEVLTGKIVNSNFAYIAQKLEDSGFSVRQGVVVGDDREDLLAAFQKAGARADAVIVNGGLGPTVDDLSQEVAAQVAGVELMLDEAWLERMSRFFKARGRTMPANNTKQAMLPKGSDILDNPIGTACGFAIDIGKATFYFTPGVPRELFRMLEEQILPRMLSRSPNPGVILLRRFHSYGLGESHVDHLLADIEAMDPEGAIKLGFRAHYPQLETKLVCRAATIEQAREKLAPVEAEIQRIMGNFILALDDDTHESVIQSLLDGQRETLAVVEQITGGLIANRLTDLPDADLFFVQGLVGTTPDGLAAGAGMKKEAMDALQDLNIMAEHLAATVRQQSGSSYGLAVLGQLDGPPRGKAGHMTAALHFALADRNGTIYRRSSLTGNREWLRKGAAEMGLDVIRRHLQGLPIDEKTDFELRDDPPASASGTS